MNSLTAPVSGSERIQMLDVIRGFALLGILLMNIEYFQRPLTAMMFGFDNTQVGADYTVGWLVYTFVQGKFYTMFSLLFGIGFVLFYDRAKAKVDHPRWLFFRRIFYLALFGLIHIVYIWGGDILLNYAICGLFLMLFVNTPASRLWKWGTAFLLFPIALFWLAALGIWAAMQSPEGSQAIIDELGNSQVVFGEIINRAEQVYATGTFSDAVGIRLEEVSMLYGGGGIVFFMPTLVGIFLIGASLARAGIFTSFEKHPLAYKKMLMWGLILGLPSALYVGIYGLNIEMMMPTFNNATIFTITQIANIGLCLAYMSMVALALRSAKRAKKTSWLHALAPAGRMALTNYLAQSIIFTSIFYGYALGLYGTYGRATATVMAVVVYILQLYVSHWWLQRYRFGPLEWLWRTATYFKMQPFRKVTTTK